MNLFKFCFICCCFSFIVSVAWICSSSSSGFKFFLDEIETFQLTIIEDELLAAAQVNTTVITHTVSAKKDPRPNTCEKSDSAPKWCAECPWRKNSNYPPKILRKGHVNMQSSHKFHVFAISDEFSGAFKDVPYNITFGRRVYWHSKFDNMRDANYLLFIVDNYDNLAEYVAFVHGHQSSWHQRTDLKIHLDQTWKKINKFDAEKCPNGIYYSYAEMNKDKDCSSWPNPIFNNDHMNCLWVEYFEPEMMLDEIPCVSAPCCGQFVASRDRIRSRPLDFWMRLVNYGRTCLSKRGQSTGMFTRTKCTANILEYVWHVIFREPADYRSGIPSDLRTCVKDSKKA